MPQTARGFLPTFDDAAAHPEFETARVALRKLDWPALAAFFDALPDQNARSFAYRSLGDIEAKGTDQFLAETAHTQTATTTARVLYANRLIRRAWKARTHARARHVPREQFAVFHRELALAEQLLGEVTALDPGNAPAWAAGLDTARGLQMGPAEARRRYEQAVTADPRHFRAQWLLVQQLAPKWGGSLDAMHCFARECLDTAAGGSLNPVQVVDAHVEHWLELGRGWKALKYLRQSRVRDEVQYAAECSVLHPDFRHPYGWVQVQSTFAMAFSLIGDHSAAAVHFRALGRHASKLPWGYLGEPAEQFVQHRSRSLAKG